MRRTFVKVLTLCFARLVAALLLQAQQVVSTLTCFDSFLNAALTLPVYAFYIDTKNSGSKFEVIAASVGPRVSYTLATFSFDLISVPSSIKLPRRKRR